MSNAAKERIFSRLRSAVRQKPMVPKTPEPPALPDWTKEEKITLLKEKMEAVKSQVHRVSKESWTDALKEILKEKKVETMLFAPETDLGKSIESAWKKDSEGLPQLIQYESDIEAFKDKMFAIDAGITSTRGGIADTGALILWPDESEPRLMSLVPPIHIAVLDADTIFNTFSEAMEAQNWRSGMPTNSLLISGPSKTADIELVLAFGVHGPKELVVLVAE